MIGIGIGNDNLFQTNSMSKARKMGWHGFVDTEECIYEVLEDFVKLKMLPPIPPAK